MPKYNSRHLDGILLLDKALDVSSNYALQKVKHLFQAKKAGHTGSLDPLATGMLPICFGKATKLAQFLLGADKQYTVTAKLGEVTTTGDAEGEVIETKPVPKITEDALQAVIAGFKGEISQIPPMYSAVKIAGKPLYQLARQGITVERQSRPITVYAITLRELALPFVTLDVHCSKGTYIRTLAQDIGDALGCGAYVTALRRTAVSHFAEEKMLSMDQLLELSVSGGLAALDQQLLSIEDLSRSWPMVTLSSLEMLQLRDGLVIASDLETGLLARIYSSKGHFLGIAEKEEQGLKARYIEIR